MSTLGSAYFYAPSEGVSHDAMNAQTAFNSGSATLVSSPTRVSLIDATYQLIVSGIDLSVDQRSLSIVGGLWERVDLYKTGNLLYSVVPATLYAEQLPDSLTAIMNPFDPDRIFRFFGSVYDDVFPNGGASHQLIVDGGRGLDTVTYSGSMGSYTIKSASPTAGLSIQDNRAGRPDGLNLVSNIEVLQFVDERVSTLDLLFNVVQPLDSNPTGPQVFRFSNANTGSYFYTNDPVERDYLLQHSSDSPMRLETATFNAHQVHATGDATVFRFANESNGGYFLTASPVERDWVIEHRPDLRLDYEFFFEPAAASADTAPVFRLSLIHI